jgi:RNA polymerase sigma-70 factor, ECF subfamily
VNATLEAVGERHGQPTAAVVTSDGATWSWPDLFAQFAPAIHSFARSRGASSPDDVVQDVFATAVERFPTFSGDSSGLRSFLFTLAYRRVADDHRVRYRRQEQLVADHEPNAEVTVGLEDSITELETASEAMKALEVLGERERRVIEMRIIDEASPAEVADALGLSNGNVRVIQARALMKVRKYLETRSGALPSFGLAFTFLKGLRSEFPSRGGLAEWIETIQAESMRGTANAAAAGAGSAIAAGSGATASVGAIAGSVLKIGLVVALATVTAVDVETSADDPTAQVVPRAEAAAAVVPVVGGTERADTAEPPSVAAAPTPSIGVAPVVPPRADSVTPSASEGQSTAVADDDPAGPESEPAAPGSPVETVAEPVVGGVVDPVIEDVGNTVENVVSGVVDTVDTVVDDVIQPVIDTVVDVVEETVDTVGSTVDDTVGTLVELVDETTDTVDSLVGGITSGLGG